MSASSSNATEQVEAVLAELPMLKLLTPDLRRLVTNSFVRASFDFGDVIVKEGDEADGFYVLVSGSARAFKRTEDGEEISLNTLAAGDTFGERALLGAERRTATIRASSAVEVLKLDKTVFRALVQLRPEIGQPFELHIRRHELRDFFRLFSPLGRLPVETLEALIGELEPVTAEQGEIVIRQADGPAALTIVEEGRLRAYIDLDGGRTDVAYLRRGDFFCNGSVRTGSEQTYTVEAVSSCRLLQLGREAFERLSEDAAFRAVVDDHMAQYDYKRVARVPLDFADEIVPEPAQFEEVSLDHVGAADSGAPTSASLTVAEAEAAPPAEKPTKRIRRFPHLWQVDQMDCGAASLAIVCRYYGRPVSLAHIRKLVTTGVDGTSLTGITTGAVGLGLRVRAVKASKSRLRELPLPAIVHWEGNHWVVLYDVDEKRVRISDPARGLRRLSREEFDDKWTGYAALVAYGEGLDDAPVAAVTGTWIWQFFRPYWRTLLAGAALALVGAALQMVVPVFTEVVVNDVLAVRDVGLLQLLLVAMGGVLLAMTAATVTQRYLLSRAAVSLDASMLDFVASALLALPMSYFNARRTGDIQRRLAGMQEIRTFVVVEGVRALTASATLAATVVVMFVYDRFLGLVFLATAPLYAALMVFSRRRLRPTFDSLQEALGKYYSHQIDAIKGIEAVKAMAAERAFHERMLKQFNALRERVFRADLTIMLYEGAVQLVSVASLALFLAAGSFRFLSGDLTIGEFVAFNALVLLATAAIVNLLSIWDELQFSSVLINRLNDVIEQEPEQGLDRSRLRPVKSIEGAVRLQNVGFTYGGPVPTRVLDGISLSVAPGSTVAIVGRSGSGKTTLARCLAGLLEPTTGTIFYDGVDLRTLSYRDLRRHIGYVLQENHLFDDTIAQNIAFDDNDPDIEQVVWAARVANAHDFIMRLPLCYETRVGETGLLLSGGQRQRIAIARALYRRPAVLILDEATSSLDSESERAIQANLGGLLESRTSFVIAHRLSTIRDADLIVVFDKGRLAEQGTHQELMERRGIYYYLVSQQLAL
jgi:ATP-binding cassette subfamily B protein